jgi:hypothetical protein
VKGDLLEESEARRCAEEFGRTLTGRWDEWAFELDLLATPASRSSMDLPGSHGERRTGTSDQNRGNWPLIVDPDTGACRLARVTKEMAELRGFSGADVVRFRDATARRRRAATTVSSCEVAARRRGRISGCL